MSAEGPWFADLHNERRDGGRFYVYIRAPHDLVPVACVTTGVEGYGRDEGRARATLIAAAPDLLEALADLFERGEVHVALAGNPIACEQLEAKCRAAIAKAKGEVS